MRVSPLLLGSMPVFSRMFVISSLVFPRSAELRALRRVFLRRAKAAFITLNYTSGLFTLTGGSSLMVSFITAELTLGGGIKDDGGTVVTISDVA